MVVGSAVIAFVLGLLHPVAASADGPRIASAAYTGYPLDCAALVPRSSAQQTYDDITWCLKTGPKVAQLTEGEFLVPRGITLPAFSQLHGSKTMLTRLRIVSRSSVTSYVIRTATNSSVTSLTFDAAEKLPTGCCTSIIRVKGNGSFVQDVTAANLSNGVGVYFFDETSANNHFLRVDIRNCYYGVVFVHGLVRSRRNLYEGGVIENIKCDSVTFAGYGELVGSTIRDGGFGCAVGDSGFPVPGSAVMCSGNTAGGVIVGNVMYDTCGMILDVDSCADFDVAYNDFRSPGNTVDGKYPHCAGASTITLLDSQDFRVEGNTVFNTRPSNMRRLSLSPDPAFTFSDTEGAEPLSDLPGQGGSILNFVVAQRPHPGAGRSVGHQVVGNKLVAACPPGAAADAATIGCVAVGLFVGRGTGEGAPAPAPPFDAEELRSPLVGPLYAHALHPMSVPEKAAAAAMEECPVTHTLRWRHVCGNGPATDMDTSDAWSLPGAMTISTTTTTSTTSTSATTTTTNTTTSTTSTTSAANATTTSQTTTTTTSSATTSSTSTTTSTSSTSNTTSTSSTSTTSTSTTTSTSNTTSTSSTTNTTSTSSTSTTTSTSTTATTNGTTTNTTSTSATTTTSNTTTTSTTITTSNTTATTTTSTTSNTTTTSSTTTTSVTTTTTTSTTTTSVSTSTTTTSTTSTTTTSTTTTSVTTTTSTTHGGYGDPPVFAPDGSTHYPGHCWLRVECADGPANEVYPWRVNQTIGYPWQTSVGALFAPHGRSLYARNDVTGSDYGSRRCGHNAYAPSTSQCLKDAGNSSPACNDNDYKHLFEAFRNDPDCAEYFAPVGKPRPPSPEGRLRNPLPEAGYKELRAAAPPTYDHLFAVLEQETAMKAANWSSAWGGGDQGVLGAAAQATGVPPRTYPAPDWARQKWAPPLSLYQRVVMASRPVGYWRFGECDGFDDQHAVNFGTDGEASNAVLVGGVEVGVDGLLGSDSDCAVKLDGTSQQVIRIPDSMGINLEAHETRTVELWFRADSMSGGKQMLYEEGGLHRGLNIYLVHTSSTQTVLVMNGWNRFESDWGPVSIQAEIWLGEVYHAALVLDGNPDNDTSTNDGTISGYFNGFKFGVVERAGVLHEHGGGIGVGGVVQNTRYADASTASAGANFVGVIDEVAIYNVALADETIASHYFAGRGGGDPPCVDKAYPQAECSSLWCCQWHAGCWSGVGANACPLKSPVCMVADEKRSACGWPGISKAECKSLSCCWDPIRPNPQNRSWCYLQAGTCDGVCSEVQNVNRPDQPRHCKDGLCTVQECCEDAKSCEIWFCNETHHIDKRVPPSYCKAAECTVDECCDDLGTCPGTCDLAEGFKYKQDGLPQYCADTVCTRQECCDELGTCAGVCTGDWADKPTPPAYCRETSCTFAECCVYIGAR